nr:Peptidase M1 domain containing protein [Haemonchus contortus]
MFALGIILGGFLHAVAFPNANSPLALGNWSFESSAEVALFDNSTNSQTEAVKHAHNPSESNQEETEVELTTDAIYEDEGPDDADCRDFPYKNFRLPRDVVPTSYNLTIHPNITTNNMTGSLAIDIQVLNTTKLIVLHADNLIMTTFSMSVNARRMEAEFFFCPASSQWAFMMDEEVHAGDFIDLGIEFQGEVLPDLQGLYISTHTDSRGRKTKSAVTQFEPSYARKMFPCFDEPNFKATFEICGSKTFKEKTLLFSIYHHNSTTT